MSIESDFRALLAGYAPLTALVGARIALNAVPEGQAFPLVVFSASQDRQNNIDGTLAYIACTLSVQCWAKSSEASNTLADAVIAAVATAPALRSALVTERSTTFDPELDADGTTLTVSWWQTS